MVLEARNAGSECWQGHLLSEPTEGAPSVPLPGAGHFMENHWYPSAHT